MPMNLFATILRDFTESGPYSEQGQGCPEASFEQGSLGNQEKTKGRIESCGPISNKTHKEAASGA